MDVGLAVYQADGEVEDVQQQLGQAVVGVAAQHQVNEARTDKAGLPRDPAAAWRTG